MNILFFAKYAKKSNNVLPEDKEYLNYHQNIYKILKSMDYNIIPCNDFYSLIHCENIDYIFRICRIFKNSIFGS